MLGFIINLSLKVVMVSSLFAPFSFRDHSNNKIRPGGILEQSLRKPA